MKLEYLQKDRISLTQQFSNKEFYYLEKIKSLESQLNNSDKSDITLVTKQNKDYESQIDKLNKIISNMNIKQNEEKQKFNHIVTEVMSLKEKLKEEIRSLENLKKEVLFIEEHNSKNVPPTENKTKMILKNSYNSDQDEGFEKELSVKDGKVLPIKGKNLLLNQKIEEMIDLYDNDPDIRRGSYLKRDKSKNFSDDGERLRMKITSSSKDIQSKNESNSRVSLRVMNKSNSVGYIVK